MPDWDYVGIAQIVTAVAAILIPFGFAGAAWYRRPSVSLAEDPHRIQSQLEGEGNRWPHIRLIASNKAGKRVASGTRVVLDGYRAQGKDVSQMVTLGSPLLGWPSANSLDGSIPLFPGAQRPIDLGSMLPMRVRPDGTLPIQWVGDPAARQFTSSPVDKGGAWCLRLGLAFDLAIANNRDILKPGAWVISLTIGADDANATRYEVASPGRGLRRTPRLSLRPYSAGWPCARSSRPAR